MSKRRQPEREGTLGSHLRGARLGWRWLSQVQAYVRVSDTADGFRLDVAPAGQIPARGTDGRSHRCWWEGDDIGPELARLIEATLAGGHRIRRLHRRVVIDFTDDGTPVGQVPTTS